MPHHVFFLLVRIGEETDANSQIRELREVEAAAGRRRLAKLRPVSDNWLATVPGKCWFTILRMYGPLEPWINKTWRPGEIELAK